MNYYPKHCRQNFDRLIFRNYLIICPCLIIYLFLIFCDFALSSQTYKKNLYQLLSSKECNNCILKNIDLVNEDLRGASLRGSDLEGSNLSGSNLDKADLRRANLINVIMSTSSIRGANFIGAKIEGTNFNESDLTNAIFDYGALSKSHWEFAIGINPDFLTYADVYNAGVKAYMNNRFITAEKHFNNAAFKEPGNINPLIARAASRINQGKIQYALGDLQKASELSLEKGNIDQSKIIKDLAGKIIKSQNNVHKKGNQGNILKQVISSLTLFRYLSPIGL